MEKLLTPLVLASTLIVPFFFTDSFYEMMTGRDMAALTEQAQSCGAYEQCVTECTDAGASESFCATDTCAAKWEFAPETVFACRDAHVD